MRDCKEESTIIPPFSNSMRTLNRLVETVIYRGMQHTCENHAGFVLHHLDTGKQTNVSSTTIICGPVSSYTSSHHHNLTMDPTRTVLHCSPVLFAPSWSEACSHQNGQFPKQIQPHAASVEQGLTRGTQPESVPSPCKVCAVPGPQDFGKFCAPTPPPIITHRPQTVMVSNNTLHTAPFITLTGSLRTTAGDEPSPSHGGASRFLVSTTLRSAP